MENQYEGNVNYASSHQAAHDAVLIATQTTHEHAHNAANMAVRSETKQADYIQNVGNFVAAALDPLGIDVQVYI